MDPESTETAGPRWALWVGPLVALVVGGLCGWTDMGWPASATAAVTTLCALWWVLEPISIPATSMIPFAAFPLLGVLDHEEVATAYGHTLILLLLGGFVLSTAMERSGAHRRLAVGMVRMVGGGSKRLVLGFMLASAVLSMWISNTATVLILLPVALAVVSHGQSELRIPLLLGIAYAASIGGLGTPVGTPPNVIFMGIYEETTGRSVSFLDWMKIGVPAAAALLPVAWLVVTRNLSRSTATPTLPVLGPWRPAERRVLWVFSITALLWITRTAPLGGWAGWLDIATAGDATVAFAAVLALFVMPDGDGKRMLDWQTANKIPWGLLILFGGGIAIAKAFEASGLSAILGQQISGVVGLHPILMIAFICLAVTFLTEVTSNTATTNLLMPILAAAGIAAQIDPALLMIPAALSASCAFMLPVATAPNAIVFGTGHVTVRRMAKEGVTINFLGAGIITVLCWLLLGA